MNKDVTEAETKALQRPNSMKSHLEDKYCCCRSECPAFHQQMPDWVPDIPHTWLRWINFLVANWLHWVFSVWKHLWFSLSGIKPHSEHEFLFSSHWTSSLKQEASLIFSICTMKEIKEQAHYRLCWSCCKLNHPQPTSLRKRLLKILLKGHLGSNALWVWVPLISLSGCGEWLSWRLTTHLGLSKASPENMEHQWWAV